MLSLTIDTVAIDNKTDVETVLAAYSLLSPEAQLKLTIEKALLDSLLSEIVKQEDEAAAATAVVIAETDLTDETRTAAQILVTALADSSEKTALQIRLDAIITTEDLAAADQADVDLAQSLIEDYFVSSSVIVTDYSVGTKYDAFLSQANQIVDGLGVIISVDSVVHDNGNKPSTFTLSIEKNGAIIQVTVDVYFTTK